LTIIDTTRPRVGFEDELWTRMQASRAGGITAARRLARLIQAVPKPPAVPIAAVAAVLGGRHRRERGAYSGLRFGWRCRLDGEPFIRRQQYTRVLRARLAGYPLLC